MPQGFEKQREVSLVLTSGNKVVQAAPWKKLASKRNKKHFINWSAKRASQVLFQNTGTDSVLDVKTLQSNAKMSSKRQKK